MSGGGSEDSCGYTDIGFPEVKEKTYAFTVLYGKALIIVNKNFYDKRCSRKVNHDYIEDLQNLLHGAGFIHEYHEDLTASQIVDTARNFDTEDLAAESNPDSLLLVVVVSHGMCGKIKGVDGQDVFIKTIVDEFGRRKNLETIPKIFIAQCCQDFWTPELNDQENFQRKVIPITCPNVHVEYTTLPGGKDFDLTSRGSIYFDRWLKVMEKYGHEWSLHRVFQHTRLRLDRVIVEYEGKRVKVCPLSFSSLQAEIFVKPKDGTKHSFAGPYVKAETEEDGYPVLGPLDHVEGLPYFHPAISDDKQVKATLKSFRDQQGSFLLRHSKTTPGKYVFSIVISNRKIVFVTLDIRESRDGRFYSLSDRKFGSLKELVQNYRATYIPTTDQRTDLFLTYPICP